MRHEALEAWVRRKHSRAGITKRIDNEVDAQTTPIGLLPTPGSINLNGLDLSPETERKLFEANSAAWLEEANRTLDFLAQFKARLPTALLSEHQSLLARITRSSP